MATFEQLTPDVYEHLDRTAERLREGIRAVCAEFDIPVQVTGIGSLFCVHFNDQAILSQSDIQSNDREREWQVFYGLLNERVWPSTGLLGAVSAPMTNDDVDAYVDGLRNVLARNRQGRTPRTFSLLTIFASPAYMAFLIPGGLTSVI